LDYAKIIKQLRDKLVLTQSEFALLLGVASSTVSRWEKGLHEPTIKQKRRIVELCKENGVKL